MALQPCPWGQGRRWGALSSITDKAHSTRNLVSTHGAAHARGARMGSGRNARGAHGAVAHGMGACMPKSDPAHTLPQPTWEEERAPCHSSWLRTPGAAQGWRCWWGRVANVGAWVVSGA